MLRKVLLVPFLLLVACDETPPAVTGDGGDKTPLEEVEEILTGETDGDGEGAEPAEPETPGNPQVPVAKPVPNKPGFVISPHNGKWIDVTGIAPGELMLDPHFPAEEKRYFRVPKPPVPEPEVEEDAPTEEAPAAEAEG